eukprot:9375399-Alexandrium_andersonii.AAC.1
MSASLVGSEMCIRDSACASSGAAGKGGGVVGAGAGHRLPKSWALICSGTPCSAGVLGRSGCASAKAVRGDAARSRKEWPCGARESTRSRARSRRARLDQELRCVGCARARLRALDLASAEARALGIDERRGPGGDLAAGEVGPE